ncbi:MAG: sugar nucleotide-binding protein, partial [Clostridia bacterium]|nr:sugar nucleotide-binding protein [Clostridia bacterium]
MRLHILVTGAQGQLGYDLCSILREEGHETLGVDRSDFDLTDRVATERFLDAS